MSDFIREPCLCYECKYWLEYEIDNTGLGLGTYIWGECLKNKPAFANMENVMILKLGRKKMNKEEIENLQNKINDIYYQPKIEIEIKDSIYQNVLEITINIKSEKIEHKYYYLIEEKPMIFSDIVKIIDTFIICDYKKK